MRFRTAALAAAATAALLLGACGGGASSSGGAPTTEAPAGSGVKQGTGGYIGGPVNTARQSVNDLNRQQSQEEQQAGG